MIRPRVYIETSIPSFYYEIRTEHDMLARKNWTREWWDFKRQDYELMTSEAVLDELSCENSPIKHEALSLLNEVPLLPVEPSIADIVETYIRRSVMPRDPTGDALHLALASYHKCDFLLTWNCNHLANANKFRHIQQVNTMLGLYVPALVTPLELLGEEETA